MNSLKQRVLLEAQLVEFTTAESLANQLDINLKTVQAALRELVATGELERNFTYSEDGIGRYTYKAV